MKVVVGEVETEERDEGEGGEMKAIGVLEIGLEEGVVVGREVAEIGGELGLEGFCEAVEVVVVGGGGGEVVEGGGEG